MLVRHRMSQHPVTISPSDTLASARAKMQAGHFRRLPVEDAGQLVGIVTDRDIRGHAGIEARTRVNMVMTAPAITVSSDTPVEEAARLMLTKQVGGLPVVEAGQLGRHYYRERCLASVPGGSGGDHRRECKNRLGGRGECPQSARGRRLHYRPGRNGAGGGDLSGAKRQTGRVLHPILWN